MKKVFLVAMVLIIALFVLLFQRMQILSQDKMYLLTEKN